MSCSWQEHDGRRYLRVEYTGDVEQDAGLSTHVAYLVLSEPEGSTVRVLYDVTRGRMSGWDREELAEGKRLARLNKEHCSLRVAMVGVRGPLAALLRGMSAATGFPLIPCRDEASAIEYLFRH